MPTFYAMPSCHVPGWPAYQRHVQLFRAFLSSPRVYCNGLDLIGQGNAFLPLLWIPIEALL